MIADQKSKGHGKHSLLSKYMEKLARKMLQVLGSTIKGMLQLRLQAALIVPEEESKAMA